MLVNEVITLTRFTDEDDITPWLDELCHELLKAESPVQVRMILKLYLEDRLEGVEWGGCEV